MRAKAFKLTFFSFAFFHSFVAKKAQASLLHVLIHCFFIQRLFMKSGNLHFLHKQLRIKIVQVELVRLYKYKLN